MSTVTGWTNVDMSTPAPENNPQPNLQGCAQKGQISESRASHQMYTRVDMSTCPPLTHHTTDTTSPTPPPGAPMTTADPATPAGRPMCGDAAHARWATAHTAQTPPSAPDPLAVGIAGGITSASRGPRASILSTNGGQSWADDMSHLGVRRWSR